jgi:uncharacterized protein GlcG (DUF336 family)
MYNITLLGLPECMKAMGAMLERAPSVTTRPVAMAIVNEYGELMSFVRMDGASPHARDYAVKKAYTAARMRSDLKDFRAGLEQRGRSVSDFADPNLVGSAAGGVAIMDATSSAILGAIGVSGGTPDEDEAIARVGLGALQSPE